MPDSVPVPTPDTAALPWRDVTMDDAPAYLDADTANGWAMGYNAARDALLAEFVNDLSEHADGNVGDGCWALHDKWAEVKA